LTRSASRSYSTPELTGATVTRHPLRGYLFIAGAALFWGISATLGRAVFTGRFLPGGEAMRPVDPLILAQSRTTFSLLVLVPILLVFRGRRSLAVGRSELLRFMVLGTLGLAASNYFYYLAIQQTTVATAIILQYIAPVFVLLWMVGTRQQRATPQRIAGVILAVLGCVLAIGIVARISGAPYVWFTGGSVKFNVIGVAAALIAAVSFAFYNVYGRKLIASHDRWTVITYAFFGAAAAWLLINPPWRIIAAQYSPGQYLFLVVFAVLSVLIPFSLYFAGLHHLDATRAIVTSCLEPVFAIVIAAIALGEAVNGLQVTGIVVVLAATVLVQFPEKGKTATPLEPIE
jgi:drug/metabolite transporter (DMT)-like permease